MNHRLFIGITMSALLMLPARANGEETNPCPGTVRTQAADAWFSREVWAKVGATECLKCHNAGGDAEETRFVLKDLSRTPEADRVAVMRHNRNAFAQVARTQGRQSVSDFGEGDRRTRSRRQSRSEA